MTAPASSLKPKAGSASETTRRAPAVAPGAAPPAAIPRYLRPSLKLGGLNDPEEHEAEHAASVIAGGGHYRVRDPGGSDHLRAAHDAHGAAAAGQAPIRAAVAPAVLDDGASGRVRRAAAPPDSGGASHLRAAPDPHAGEPLRKTSSEASGHAPIRAAVAPPVLDDGASGRVRRTAMPLDAGGTSHLRATHDPHGAEPLRRAPGEHGPVRAAAGPANAGASQEAAKQIERARSAAAKPLPPAVKARLERGFGERMDNVGLHTGPSARAAARAIGARAYTEGERITLGPGESEHDLHLMAHEATHVVQNRRAAGIARALPADPAARPAPLSENRTTGVRKSEIQKSEIQKSEICKAEAAPGQPIRRFPGLDTVLDKFADWANVIPGFRLFTIILGLNPINMSHVDRSGANILRAAVELIPGGGLIVKALETYGIFEKGGAWLEQQVASLGMAGAAIRDALMQFLDSLGLGDVLHPGDVWDRAKRIFTEPIDRIIAFFKSVALGFIELIKDAVLKPLAALAAKTPAWDLLTAILGSNPVTGEAVTPTPEVIVGGLMKLAGQEEIWARIQQTHALQRIWAWFKGAMSTLIGYVKQVPGLFIAAIKSFKIEDLLDLPGALGRVVGMFASFVGSFISWGLDAAWKLLEIVFDVVSPGAFGYIKKTGAALKSILKNPLPFVGNLVKAAKLGLSNFADNIGTHLKNGLIEWLTGALTGVYIPQALTLPEIGKFALSILGLTWMQIRAKIVKALGPTGEKIMSGLEKTASFVIALVSGGPAAAWEMIKEQLSGLKDTVIDSIKDFVTSTIVKVALPKLIAMFIPGAGFISAIISIYGTIKSFMEQLGKIVAAVTAFIDSIVAIAEGQIGGAAKKVEGALAGVVSVAIGLLAGFLGLGGISAKVTAVIKKVQATVDKALDTAINWLIGKAKALFGKLFGKGDKKDERTEEEKQADLNKAIDEATSLQKTPNITEEALRKGLLPIKNKYKMVSLDLVVDSKDKTKETVHIFGEINPKKPSDRSEIATGGWPEGVEKDKNLWVPEQGSHLATITSLLPDSITYTNVEGGKGSVTTRRDRFMELWNGKQITLGGPESSEQRRKRLIEAHGPVIGAAIDNAIAKRNDLAGNAGIFNPMQAHHIIPVGLLTRSIRLQMLVVSGWDYNAAINAAALAAGFHGSHPSYSAYVLQQISVWDATHADAPIADFETWVKETLIPKVLIPQIEMAKASGKTLNDYFATLI